MGTIGGNRGRFVVLGSTDIFADDWIECEENIKLCDILFAWLLDSLELDMASFKTNDLMTEAIVSSNVDMLSRTLKSCLQDAEKIPSDITSLFELKPFHVDLESVPQVLDLYSTLRLPHEPLGLISPQFDCPLPRSNPATFPPSMKDPVPPSLDLFDLDELMATPDARLAHLTNKCSGGADDLEYYVHEVGVNLFQLESDKGAKHILYEMFKTISSYKRPVMTISN